MKTAVKSALLTFVKISVAIVLIYWLVQSGKLDFSQLRIVTTSSEILFTVIFGWFFIFIGLAAFRWSLLLSGAGLSISYFRAVQLTLIGLFFNSTMPGAVGGDIIKAVYVIRDQKSQKRSEAMISILLDRVVGVMGLFFLGAVALILSPNYFLTSPMLFPIAMIIVGVCSITGLFLFLLFRDSSGREEARLIGWLTEKKFPGAKLFTSIYRAIRLYKKKPFTILAAILLSLLMQSLIMCFFVFLTEKLNSNPVNLLSYASIYPVGILVTALPIAPAGMGVGHVAFDNLYHLIGLNNGANVFNIYVLCSLVLNLSGVIPYLFFKSSESSLNAGKDSANVIL